MGFVIGLATGLLIAATVFFGWINPYGSRLRDFYYHPKAPDNSIVLVAIDDATVDAYGWPIERVTHGAFLFALIRAEPRAVVLDFFLPDPTSREEDTFFARIIERVDKIAQPVLGIEATRFSPLPNQFPAFDAILKPAPVLLTPNTVLAHAMIYPDPDGIVRRIPLAIDGPNQNYPAIAVAAWTLLHGREPKIEIRANQFFFESKLLPTDSQGQALINFVQRDAIRRVSYLDIARGKVDPGILKDKIILVGPTTQIVHENYTVPLTVANTPLYNVEIQASLLDTLLTQDFLAEQDTRSRIITVILVGLLAGMTLIQFHRLYAAALGILYFGAYMLFAFWQFDRGLLLMPLDVGAVLGITLIITMAYRYIAEERTRAFIARIFLGSVAPEAVHEVLAQYDRGGLALSGGRREISILSVTLRGLAPLSEASAPEAVIQLMNAYSAHIFEIVFRHGGSIYSQVGNTVIAMWNLALTQEDHAPRAVSAAFEIQQQTVKLGRKSPRQTPVESGLGIATGPVVVGHLPVSQRAEYSVIGDVVNVAERLSVLATQNHVIVDTLTRDQAGDTYESKPAQIIRLRGKKESVETWELSPRATVKQISSA
jgi:adenylate cyclase